MTSNLTPYKMLELYDKHGTKKDMYNALNTSESSRKEKMFNRLRRDGYIKYHRKETTYHLTEKGKQSLKHGRLL